MKIGLFFGSFSPMHVGHAVVGSYCAQLTDLDELWLVPSPHNPLKNADELWPENQRLALLRDAVERNHLPLKICEIELSLPRPSYTITTLRALQQLHPQEKFVVIMGADCLAGIEQWREWQAVLRDFEVYAYPRRGYDAEALCATYGAKFVAAPMVEISSTFVREMLRQGKEVGAFVPWKQRLHSGS
jgi:nicotinate-nucleotide adenylyltransferase